MVSRKSTLLWSLADLGNHQPLSCRTDGAINRCMGFVSATSGPDTELQVPDEILQNFGMKTSFSKDVPKLPSMPALASYRTFPHIETTVSTSCEQAVFYSQLCRFAYRCTRRYYFVDAASRLMRDVWLHGYDLKFLRCKLYSFQATFWRTSTILVAAPC